MSAKPYPQNLPSYANVSRHAANSERTKAGVSLAVRHSPNAGRILGESRSRAKAEAAQDNGKLGGRPKGS